MRKVSVASQVYGSEKKGRRREKFLEEMGEVIPRGELLEIIRRYYPKARKGWRPVLLDRMLWIYSIQQRYRLSDQAMENWLYNIESVWQTAGIDLEIDVIPDERRGFRW